MTTPVCPLSGSADVELVEEIPTRDLVALYRRIFRVDVEREFDTPALKLYRSRESDLRFFHPSATGSEAFYEQLQQFDWYYPAYKSEFDFAARWVKAGDRVLDVGCGNGAFAKHSPGGSYLGLELSRAAKEQAAKQGIRVENEFVEDHAAKHEGQYDVVCAFQVIEHVSDVRGFLEACLRCLEPGGTLVISAPSVDSFSSIVTNFALDLPPHHVTRWSDETFARIPRYVAADHLETWHEPLPDTQRQLYLNETLRYALMKRLGFPFRSVDTRLSLRLLGVAARVIGRVVGSGIVHPRLGLHGVFAAAAYRKRG